MKIAVTGANSSVGLNLLEHVGDLGDWDVTACVRSERAAASLPRSPRTSVHVVPYDDAARLSETLAGATCLVHLAGILIERPGTSYEAANVLTAEAVARAAGAAGVGHLVLVSVVGASAESRNRYFRTKGEAERAFSSSGIATTVLRTPILLGPGTAGAAALTRTVRTRKARLLGGGRYTMRPLDLDDLSEAIIAICGAGPDGAVVHELVGPEPIAYRALVERAARTVGVDVSLGSMPIGLAKAGAWLRSRLRRGGVTPTVIDVITMDEVVEENADAELGITLTPLNETLNKILKGERAT
jgi:NADH dehydrogenase